MAFSSLDLALQTFILDETPLKEKFPQLQEALEFCVKYKVPKVNLKGFAVEDQDLNYLASNNLDLRVLIVASQALSQLSHKLKGLEYLDMSFCTNISSIPEEMDKLQTLICIGCTKLSIIPKGMENLVELDIRGTLVNSLPNDLDNLKTLTLTEQQRNKETITDSVGEDCLIIVA